jgi:hypothetical protein
LRTHEEILQKADAVPALRLVGGWWLLICGFNGAFNIIMYKEYECLQVSWWRLFDMNPSVLSANCSGSAEPLSNA